MSELPQGWVEATFSELLELKYGKALPNRVRDGHGFPVYGSNGIVGNHSEPLTNCETLIIGRKGSVGEVQYSAGPCSPIDTTYYVDCLWGMPFNFWLYYLRHLKLQDLNKATAVPGLSRKDAYRLPVHLAPFNEQKRIADKLETLLGRVDACRNRLDRVPLILKRFRQTLLAAATSGALTEEWRKTNRQKRNWPKAHLAEIGDLGRGKSRHRPRNDSRLYGGTYPFIQTGDVSQSGGTIHSHTQTYSDFGLAQSKLWPASTVCITIAANIGDTAILSDPACFPDSVVGFIANPLRCLPQFVKWSIDVIRAELEAFAPATAQKNINLAVLNNVEFELPPLVEQHEIVRRVEILFAFADRLEARYTAARTQVENMTPALLAMAFSGELVPQDPNDEPASELLKRIKEQKTSELEQKRIPQANTINNERHMKTKAVTTLDELVSVLDQLGGDAMANRLVIESGLSDDIDRFFELLREGRNTLLDVPVGENMPIRRIVDANQ